MSDPNMEEGSIGMTRDTKVGLLAGLAFIICFAIILSNRGAHPPQPADQPYLVDRGVDARQVAQPTTAPPTNGQALSGRARDASPLPPSTVPSARNADPVRSVNSAGDDIGSGVATSGASVVLPLQPTPAHHAPGTTDAVQTEHTIPWPNAQTPQPQPYPVGGQTSGTPDRPLRSRPLDQGNAESLDGRVANSADRPLGVPQPALAPGAESPAPTARSSSSASRQQRYTVAPGDTLHKIAMQHYGSRSASVINSIIQANRRVLSNPNVLHSGIALTLPVLQGTEAVTRAKPADEKRAATPGPKPTPPTSQKSAPAPSQKSATPASQKPAPKPDAAEPSMRWYQVRKNDRLVSIARDQLGDAARWREIHQLNKDKFPDPQRIREGVRIKLPGTAVASVGGARR